MATSTNPLLDDKIILQYPTGIQYDEEYVMFRINTSTTKFLRNDKKYADTLVTTGRTGTGVATLGSPDNKDPDITTRFGPKNTKDMNWTRQKDMVTLNKVIVLPMPNDHNVRTSVHYNDQHDPGMLTKLGDLANQGMGSAAKELAVLGLTAGVSNLVGRLKSDITNTKQLLAEGRRAINPKKEVMFDSFGYRTFNMVYTFAPKSAQEAEMVRSIIETFRYYSLPEISAAKTFYLFPSEFEILFLKGDKDNPMIPRVTTSVLKSINVNYTPQGVWSSLPDGSPVAIHISMEFLEMELVDRTRVWNEQPILSGF